MGPRAEARGILSWYPQLEWVECFNGAARRGARNPQPNGECGMPTSGSFNGAARRGARNRSWGCEGHCGGASMGPRAEARGIFSRIPRLAGGGASMGPRAEARGINSQHPSEASPREGLLQWGRAPRRAESRPGSRPANARCFNGAARRGARNLLLRDHPLGAPHRFNGAARRGARNQRLSHRSRRR